MARVTVEDCLEREENRFALVVLAAARTRQIMKGSHALVRAKNKPSVLSLREIAAGQVHLNRARPEGVQGWIAAPPQPNALRAATSRRRAVGGGKARAG